MFGARRILPTGMGVVLAAVAHLACNGGSSKAVDACTPGTLRCDGSTLVLCAADRKTWGVVQVLPTVDECRARVGGTDGDEDTTTDTETEAADGDATDGDAAESDGDAADTGDGDADGDGDETTTEGDEAGDDDETPPAQRRIVAVDGTGLESPVNPRASDLGEWDAHAADRTAAPHRIASDEPRIVVSIEGMASAASLRAFATDGTEHIDFEIVSQEPFTSEGTTMLRITARFPRVVAATAGLFMLTALGVGEFAQAQVFFLQGQDGAPAPDVDNPRWVLRDKRGNVVPGVWVEPGGMRPEPTTGTRGEYSDFESRRDECFRLVDMDGAPGLRAFFDLATGRMEDCYPAQTTMPGLYLDSSCRGGTYCSPQTGCTTPQVMNVRGDMYYVAGRPDITTSSFYYSPSGCTRSSSTYGPWWLWEPVPAAVLNSFPDAPYTIEAVY